LVTLSNYRHKVWILTQPSALSASYGVTHDGDPLYVDRFILVPERDDNVIAYTSSGNTFAMLVDSRTSLPFRTILADFSDPTSLCDASNVGPITSFLTRDANNHCVLQWPPALAIHRVEIVVGRMFGGNIAPTQTLYRDGYVKFVIPIVPYSSYQTYTLRYHQQLAVTLVDSDGTRKAKTQGAGEATLYYWDGSKNGKARAIGTFNVPLEFDAVPCPEGVCP
jgi:hypothetical protein